MIDPQIAGEIPANYEVEILSKEKNRIALGISTRPIFRGGKAVAVQGIARDITKRKKTEAELQEANQKLEAWVDELRTANARDDPAQRYGRHSARLPDDRRSLQRHRPGGAADFPGEGRRAVRHRSVAQCGGSRRDLGRYRLLQNDAFSPPECWALRRGRTHWVENSHSGLICRHIHHPPHDGYLCIPMMAQSEALGVLHLMQPDNVKMTETKQRMAITMSEHIAMALSNLRLHETLRSQSIRDPLTGLFNRRFMEESLELEIRRAARNQRPLGMIMIDLDHFKYFNDNFGHEAGDLLLERTGSAAEGKHPR